MVKIIILDHPEWCPVNKTLKTFAGLNQGHGKTVNPLSRLKVGFTVSLRRFMRIVNP